MLTWSTSGRWKAELTLESRSLTTLATRSLFHYNRSWLFVSEIDRIVYQIAYNQFAFFTISVFTSSLTKDVSMLQFISMFLILERIEIYGNTGTKSDNPAGNKKVTHT